MEMVKRMKSEEWELVKEYFKPSEFDSPDVKGSGKDMDNKFISKLYQARRFSLYSWTITSGWRTLEHTQVLIDKGYPVSPDSAHLYGLGCDIKITDSKMRKDVLTCLLLAAFRRIGMGKNFIHCDIMEKGKSLDRLWLY